MFSRLHFEGENNIFSPALIYYKDIIDQNTKTAIQMAGSAERIWPHVKTHKSLDIVKEQVDLGITKVKCATFAEAEMAAQTGIKSVLLAYPLVGPNIERFIKLILSYPEKEFYALADDLQSLSLLNDAASSNEVYISCLVDVNTGMNRTGVGTEQILTFYEKAEVFKHISLRGLHCYDGNRHEENYIERESKVKETIQAVHNQKKILQEAGYRCDILVMGGSPTFPCYSKNMEQVYYSPGTVFIYDAGYKKQFPDLPYTEGAAVLCRVVSHPAVGMFTIDLGYKGISAEQGEGKRGIFPELPNAEEVFQSEEHWTWRMKPGFEKECPPIGTILYCIPWHICPTTALYDHINVVSDGKFIGQYPVTARNRKLTV